VDVSFLIGITAASLTTGALLPQVIKAHTSRHTKDLSLAMFGISALGVFLWITYGLLTASVPVIIANSLTLCLMLYIIYLKVKYG
jgi:MtN3 and saliva related transmembrane protein